MAEIKALGRTITLKPLSHRAWRQRRFEKLAALVRANAPSPSERSRVTRELERRLRAGVYELWNDGAFITSPAGLVMALGLMAGLSDADALAALKEDQDGIAAAMLSVINEQMKELTPS